MNAYENIVRLHVICSKLPMILSIQQTRIIETMEYVVD